MVMNWGFNFFGRQLFEQEYDIKNNVSGKSLSGMAWRILLRLDPEKSGRFYNN